MQSFKMCSLSDEQAPWRTRRHDVAYFSVAMTEVIEDLQDSDPSLVDRVRVRDLDTELPAGIRRLAPGGMQRVFRPVLAISDRSLRQQKKGQRVVNSPGRLDIDIDAIVRIARNKLAQFDRTE